jgi:hypothetical protein
LPISQPRNERSSCADKNVAPASDWSEWRRQSMRCVENDKADAENPDDVDPDEQPHWHALKIFVQRFCARDNRAKDNDRKCNRNPEARSAQPMFII